MKAIEISYCLLFVYNKDWSRFGETDLRQSNGETLLFFLIFLFIQ